MTDVRDRDWIKLDVGLHNQTLPTQIHAVAQVREVEAPKPKLKKSELVAAVYQRLADPGHWAKGAQAYDSHFSPVNFKSPKAQSWCLTGAMGRELDDRGGFVWDHVTTALSEEMVNMFREQHPKMLLRNSVQAFNDNSEISHEDVLKMLQVLYYKLIERGE